MDLAQALGELTWLKDFAKALPQDVRRAFTLTKTAVRLARSLESMQGYNESPKSAGGRAPP